VSSVFRPKARKGAQDLWERSKRRGKEGQARGDLAVESECGSGGYLSYGSFQSSKSRAAARMDVAREGSEEGREGKEK